MSDSASHWRAPLRSAAQALSDDIEHALEGRREVEALLEPGGNGYEDRLPPVLTTLAGGRGASTFDGRDAIPK